jgi:REP element-mobilizing transposase RayT
MANTYASLCYHIVFSTKNRIPWINRNIEQRLWEYLGGIARKNKMKALRIGGFLDHVHTLVLAPATWAPSRIAQFLKGDSSIWIHQEYRELRACNWQDGYGAFTVSSPDIPEVIRYIENQRDHHRIRTFQEEYLELLKKHKIEYDERYLWG